MLHSYLLFQFSHLKYILEKNDIRDRSVFTFLSPCWARVNILSVKVCSTHKEERKEIGEI